LLKMMDKETADLLKSFEEELESSKNDATYYANRCTRELRKVAMLKHMIKNMKEK